ncbi:iron-containing alcohol dehydrogenase [Pontivivens ytuae]|uniref:Iron-containing alcohol dehydrogenase n=1 Tax=Pontivivens ytuae TaxID=2789856 RepID=A0A7S9QDD7_9RHOB|nr:iron-containing alcohol dehydrogenase [Pontivivens ytuae]QPH54785.1 iron-containing alcohol dehydrogenase [Pontivivens ytuae]
MNQIDYGFPTVLGRNLIAELPAFVHAPFLVVTMDDLAPIYERALSGSEMIVYTVRSIDEADLRRDLEELPRVEAIVGLGGGQALDVAKYLAWRRRLPLFQVPTALSVNAVYGHRAGLRVDGKVRYMGWTIPESVFIDLDVIRSAPPQLNYSGIGDVLCFHTGVLDWKYAAAQGKCESKWPYDPALAAQSLSKVEAVLDATGDIRDLTDNGIEVLLDGLKWGTSYHGAGWNPRHIEGIEHFVFYALEHYTGRKFLHGQPVCLGLFVGAVLHDVRPDEMLQAVRAVGVDIRPAAMRITWDDVETALTHLQDFVHEAGLWHSIAHDQPITATEVAEIRDRVEAAYG